MCFEITKVRLFKDLNQMFKSSIRIMGPVNAFSMNQFGQNFHIFHEPLFSRTFWME